MDFSRNVKNYNNFVVNYVDFVVNYADFRRKLRQKEVL
jgi:hypothetical protein